MTGHNRPGNAVIEANLAAVGVRVRTFAAHFVEAPPFECALVAPFFHEFVVCCPEGTNVDEINAHLLEEGILGGYNLEKVYPELKQRMLIAVTEMNSREDIESLCEILSEVSNA